MNREKTEERKRFTRDDKVFILDKSEGRCSHCGKRLSVDDSDFTIEHIIPISKGGTNNPSNIVALCKECNTKKSDDIIFPTSYFRYIKEEFLKEMYNNQINYYININWFNTQNFMIDDVVELRAYTQVRSHSSKRISVKGDRHKRRAMAQHVEVTYKIIKAKYSDLDEIYNHIEKYNKKYGIETKGTKDKVAEMFSKGVYYILRNTINEVVAVIPMALVNVNMGDEEKYIIQVFNPMCIYNKEHYIDAIIRAIGFIIECISGADLNLESPVSNIPIILEYNESDPVSCNAFIELATNHGLSDIANDEYGFRYGLLLKQYHNKTRSQNDKNKVVLWGESFRDSIDITSKAIKKMANNSIVVGNRNFIMANRIYCEKQ